MGVIVVNRELTMTLCGQARVNHDVNVINHGLAMALTWLIVG